MRIIDGSSDVCSADLRTMSDGATQPGRRLWELYAAGSPGAPDTGEPDPDTLAAWLDGRLDEAEAGPVEGWVAARPEVAAFVASLRADPDRKSTRLNSSH